MKKYFLLILSLVLTGATYHAVAGAPEYTFVSVGYSKFSSKIEGFSEVPEGSGKFVDLSFAVRPHIVLTAGYNAGSADVLTSGTTIDADIESTSLGILVHLPVNDTTDFILATAFINGNAKVDKNGVFSADVDADGGVTTIGIRAMIYEKIELNGFLHRNTIEDTSKLSISFGAAYYITDSVSVDLGYLFDSDSDSLVFGATKYF